jgi:hypothetical protein
MARCRNLIARDIEEILKLLHTTCPEVRELDITGCSDQVILRALSVRALSTLGASPMHVHERLMEPAPALAGREWPLLFRPPSPPRLPPEPHPAQRGAPVRMLSNTHEALSGLEAGLRGSLLGPGVAARTGGEGSSDVVLSVLGGSGGVKENAEADGELAKHGHWYYYPPCDYGARRPRRLQNIRALSISGDATAVDFDSVASCLLAKPPQLIPKPKASDDPFQARHVRLQTEGMSAVDVVKQGPGYGPSVLAVHDAVVDGAVLEALAKVLKVNALSHFSCRYRLVIQ